MRTMVARYLGHGLTVGAVTVILGLGLTSRAAADECSAVGSFMFTLPGGFGSLRLSADGTAEMDMVLGHTLCDVCLTAGRSLRGMYRTFAIDQVCYLEIKLSTPPPVAHTDTLGAVVAFEGRQLMFFAATSPDFASGLAVRNDALTGR